MNEPEKTAILGLASVIVLVAITTAAGLYHPLGLIIFVPGFWAWCKFNMMLDNLKFN